MPVKTMGGLSATRGAHAAPSGRAGGGKGRRGGDDGHIPIATALARTPVAGILVWSYGLDAQWNDDFFHYAPHTLLTGEQRGYYQDFHGLKDLGGAVHQRLVYNGQWSGFRHRRHGNMSQHCRPSRFVGFS